jgi:hypothetical protein
MRAILVSVIVACAVIGLHRPTKTNTPAAPKQNPPPTRVVIPVGRVKDTPPPKEPTAPIAVALEEDETIVFRGEYWSAPGPCIPIPGGRAMARCEAFRVIEVIKGQLPVKDVVVYHPHFGGGRVTTRNQLKPGTVYTLRLTPSECTRNLLHKDEVAPEFHVFGSELAVEEPMGAEE